MERETATCSDTVPSLARNGTGWCAVSLSCTRRALRALQASYGVGRGELSVT